MVTSSKEAAHTPLVIVHRKTFAPTDNPLNAEVAEPGTAIVPVPEINVQVPVPVKGTFPANVADEEQIVWSGPALDVVGTGSTFMVTWSEEDGQDPLEIIQRKVFIPVLNPFTGEVGEFEFEMIPVPATNVHTPVPIAGLFPANTAEAEQTV